MLKKVTCNCAPGTPFRTIEDRGAPTPDNVYPWDLDGPTPSRTGHQPGCPSDVEAYQPGEWYGNYPQLWAKQIMIPRSNGMLEIGTPINFPDDKKHHQVDGIIQANGLVSLYRQKADKKSSSSQS